MPVKSIAVGTAFDHEPVLKTKNLIKYRIHNRRRPNVFGNAGN